MNLCFRCSYLKIVFHSNLQSVLLTKKDTCQPVDTNLSAYIELSHWRCKRCHEHSMVKFVSTRGYLIPLTCTSTNFPHYILRTETKSPSAKDQRIYHMLTKYLYAPWNYQINLLVSLWFLLCLFCCHLGRICDLYFRQKYWKSFYSCDNNILFGHEIIQGIQQATSIFFSFCGVSKWESKENTFYTLG